MKTIVITAGHSNTDPGAVNGPITESQIVTDFRNMVAHYLNKSGVNFLTDGFGHNNLPLTHAIKLIQPDSLAVEFHCNAFNNPTATGVETLSNDDMKSLGVDLCHAVSSCLGIKDRGAKGEGSGQHSRLGFVRAGGLILELFFLSNPDDLKAYMDKKWVLARSVAGVLMSHASR